MVSLLKPVPVSPAAPPPAATALGGAKSPAENGVILANGERHFPFHAEPAQK
jgi:hypothetical protein